MKKLTLILALAILATSCATSSGCNYQKAQKYNAKQARKAARYYRD
jgi:PBP1b-binding outer membrane lipoprotein LpoB